MNYSKLFVNMFFGTAFAGTMMFHILYSSLDQANYIPEATVTESHTDSEPIMFSTREYIPYSVPDGDTSFKSYMSYKCITNKASKQYKLQQDAWTDKNGLRRYNSYYMVALGSFYADNVGDMVRITLDNGASFVAIVGDLKADCHTDSTNRYYPMRNGCKNVVEFIVDTSELDSSVRRSGDISTLNYFKGNISSIERIKE